MAVSATLGRPATLADAVGALEFVQYDPIRSPARAQDLILSPRVRDYRAGDLDRAYAELGLEEGYLYVYGAMTRRLWALADPRAQPGNPYRPAGLAAEVLAAVGQHQVVHPRQVAAHLGNARVQNLWGGTSTATTHALDELHRHWRVRVVGREKGVKLYGPAEPPAVPADRAECARQLTFHLARTLMPVPVPTLRAALVQLRRRGGMDASACVDELLRSGRLELEAVDGMQYLTPAGTPVSSPVPARVWFLAPFDPVVWDRRRFEHLWGWPYRFEAYVPAGKRSFGYYAIPVLVGDRAVGWALCTTAADGLSVTVRFAGRPLTGKAFRAGAQQEATRLATMLGVPLRSVEFG